MSHTVLLTDLDVPSLALREYKRDGQEKSVYYVNRSETKRESVSFQIGDTDMDKEDLPFAIMPPASYKDANPDKPGLMLAIPSAAAQAKMVEIDEKLSALVHETCKDAIKPGASLDYIKDMQTKLIKHPKKEGGRVFISLKLNRTGRYKTNVAKLMSTGDEENPWTQFPATFDDIGPNTIIFALVELSPLWFRGKEWGVSLNATDLLIINPSEEQNNTRSAGGFVIYNQVVKRTSARPELEDSGSGAGAGAPRDSFDVLEAENEEEDQGQEPDAKRKRT